jgi:hypothetical protein
MSPKMSPKASAKPPKPSAPGPRPAHVGVDARVAVLVVGGALLRVGEHLVGLLGLLELLFGLLGVVTLVAVRVVLHGQLAVGLLDVVVGGVLGHAEDVVVVALCHVDSQGVGNKTAAPGAGHSLPLRTRRDHPAARRRAVGCITS